MPGPSGESCRICYFFKDDCDIGDGWCHRLPPLHEVKSKDSTLFFQPVVYASDWCGEFKPLPEGANE